LTRSGTNGFRMISSKKMEQSQDQFFRWLARNGVPVQVVTKIGELIDLFHGEVGGGFPLEQGAERFLINIKAA
jgi:hypothetical protein